MLKARVIVTLKKEVSDPQGLAVMQALQSMDYSDVRGVRVGKFFEIALDGLSRDEAQKRVDDMSHRLLSNPVIEEYRLEIVDES